MRRKLAWLALCLAGCSLPPLRGKAEIGKDAYAIFVADGPGSSDLFAVLPTGGAPIQLTFSPVDESAPALSPDGAIVAFIRTTPGDSARVRSIWLLNLLSGAEREVPVPAAVARGADRLGWAADGRHFYIRVPGGAYRAGAPPAPAAVTAVADDEQAAADSSFSPLLGAPVFARVVDCDGGLCAASADGSSEPLVRGGAGAARWGADSVGYFLGTDFEIRPLGPGHARLLDWRPAPDHPRDLTYFPGRR